MTNAAPPLSRPPAVGKVLNRPGMQALIATHGRALVVDCLRAALDAWRQGQISDEDDLPRTVQRQIERLLTPSMRPIFNLTGTVLHTNLGRAPLPPEAIDAVTAVALGASNLEYDLETGERGDRDDHVEAWICRLTGAEAATVVNNAAAVLLVLNALAQRREVIVSRGELIEIGGSFRLPDIMTGAGCKLREVGATNRTHPRVQRRDRSAHRAAAQGAYQQLQHCRIQQSGGRSAAGGNCPRAPGTADG